MEVSIYFYGVLAALGYIILQSLFMVGVWVSAKGETEKMPDGKDYDSEMILFPLKKFLMKNRREKVFYESNYFRDLIAKIRVQIPEFEFAVSENEIAMTRSNKDFAPFVNLLNERIKRIDNKIQITLTDTGIRFHKEYIYYNFNKYIRKPVIQCPICMSSVWSIFTYWIPVIYLFGFNLPVIYMGIANTCILACVNWLIFTSRPQ